MIRPILEADIASVTAVYNWAIAHTVAHFGTEPVAEAEIRADWLTHRSRYAWLAAEVDGAFVGFAKAGPFRTRAAYDWTTELTVYVLPQAHGRGVGRALYARLIETCRRQGFRLVLGGVAVPNAASEALHRRAGMREMGRFPASGYKFGQWVDVIFYGVELVEAAGELPRPRGVREVDASYPW